MRDSLTTALDVLGVLLIVAAAGGCVGLLVGGAWGFVVGLAVAGGLIQAFSVCVAKIYGKAGN